MASSSPDATLRSQVIADGKTALDELEKLQENAHSARIHRLPISHSYDFLNEVEVETQGLIEQVRVWLDSLRTASSRYITAVDDAKHLNVLRRCSKQAAGDFARRRKDRRILGYPKKPENR